MNGGARANKESGATKHADYEKVLKMYDRQCKYSTLRGMMYAKGMYVVSKTDGSVTVDITAHTSGATAGGTSSGSSTSGGSTSGTSTPGGDSGLGDDF